MVGPGARKPSVGEGIESRRPLFLSFSLSLSYFFFTPILVCEITIIIIIIIIIIKFLGKFGISLLVHIPVLFTALHKYIPYQTCCMIIFSCFSLKLPLPLPVSSGQ